jgi:hypothetical protein
LKGDHVHCAVVTAVERVEADGRYC